MADHYYTNQPSSESKPQSFSANLLGNSFTFKTDAGVFSKDKVDYGSEVLIQAVADVDHIGGDFLDLGCGYGPIGLTLAKHFPNRLIHMVDVNERALDLAKENAEINDVSNVQIYSSSIFEKVAVTNLSAIVTNPPIRAGKQVVHQILEEGHAHLQIGGKIFVVIQKKQGAPSAKKKMLEIYSQVERIALDNGYWVLCGVK